MRSSFLTPRPAALLLLLAGALVGACGDGRGEKLIGPGSAGPSSAMYYADPDINPSDTYYLAEVIQEGSTTVDSPTPIKDPVTGAVSYQVSAQHVRETQRVEGGYDYYGRIIQVLDQTDGIPDPLVVAVNTTRRTRSVEDAVTRYDQYRQPLQNEMVQPMSMGGPSHEQITDGLMLDASAVDALSELSGQAEPLAAAAGPRAKVRRARPDEIQITNEIAPEEFGAMGVARGGPPAETQAQSVRTFRRRGQKYLLEEVEVSATRQGPDGTRVQERQVSRIRMLRFHENPVKDRERRQKRRAPSALSHDAMEPLAIQPVCPLVEPYQLQPDAEMGAAYTSCQDPYDPYQPPPPPPPSDPCPRNYSGVNVLFQHGIMSSGATWWRMDPWIRCSFRTNEHIRPNVNWFNRIDSQRDQLKPLLSSGGPQTVLVGHSNGGLVSRATAQWAQNSVPNKVRGVVTLDSPNQGAIVAINAQAMEHVIGTLLFGNGWLLFDIVKWHPFYEDDVPNSAFLNRTNSFNESFTRVGIQTHTPKRWVAWRILKTDGNCTPESYCGERAVARQTQEAYDRHRHYARFWYRPWQSIPAAASMLVMNGLDAVWNGLTAPGGRTTDGFIHGAGQVYPQANRNQLILNGDSHVGTTRSTFVRLELEAALGDPVLFALPRQ